MVDVSEVQLEAKSFLKRGQKQGQGDRIGTTGDAHHESRADEATRPNDALESGKKAFRLHVLAMPLPWANSNRTATLDIPRSPFRGSGGWIRTNGLRVMSPTSCHCSTPR